jgi:nitroreductase
MGVISNEAGWLIGKVPASVTDSWRHFVDLGFVLEEAVIRLTQLGIGTVWIAGTYNAGLAERSTPGFKVPVAVAYGEDAGNPGFVSRLFSWFSGSRTRLGFDQLFFDGDSGIPFQEDSVRWGGLLEIARLGPSAVNKQPWRLVIVGDSVHVFNAGTQPHSLFDIGIALSGIHLFAVANNSEKEVEFAVVGDPPASPLGGTYVISATVPVLQSVPPE